MKTNIKKKLSIVSFLVLLSIGSYAQTTSIENNLSAVTVENSKALTLDSLSAILDRESIQYNTLSWVYYKNGESHYVGAFAKNLKKELTKSTEALAEYSKHVNLSITSNVLLAGGVAGCAVMLTVVASPVVISAVGIGVIVTEIVALRTEYLAGKKLNSALSIYNKEMVLKAAQRSVE